MDCIGVSLGKVDPAEKCAGVHVEVELAAKRDEQSNSKRECGPSKAMALRQRRIERTYR